MPFSVRRTRTFNAAFDRALKSYPLSVTATQSAIDSLPNDSDRGDPYPGLKVQVRKLRLPLKAYRIGKSKGLRLIYMVLPDKQCLLPVYIYKKGHLQQESDVRDNIRVALRAILTELEAETKRPGQV